MANDINDANQNNDEENFGLPDLEYKPLDQLEEKHAEPVQEERSEVQAAEVEEVKEEHTYETPRYSEATSAYDDDDEKSNAPMVIGIIVGLVILVGAVLVWKFIYQPRRDKEQKELLAKQEIQRRQEADRQAKAKEEEERKRKEAEAAVVAKPTTGSIETLSNRTNRYYVIVSSAVDGDLVMDNAKKLSAKGVSAKIIPPFGKWKFYRLAISDFDSFAGAQTNADAAKGEYGSATWVMRY